MACSTNEKIRILREMHGYCQKKLASIIGVSQQDYSYLERHADELADNQLIKIIDALGVTPEFFQQFDPDVFFSSIPDNMLLKNGKVEDFPVLYQHKYAIVNNLKEMILMLKKQISRQQKNIQGLRKQNKMLNAIVREQNRTIQEQTKIIVEQQGILSNRLAEIYITK